ncbi:hypothetical protein G3T14_20440 [Methylobacterium sp. BTF04]|uniref:hypothetical protein n=1 Tax=Methylobacterium sp. BTF04 TaxID=2708300 RepID=UPI0013D384AF|nr:hypothetical protein [Methylobacterium sp. BTF04]NEU14474.1 hypothetical protein [Methylobacterium sp. BTF04]
MATVDGVVKLPQYGKIQGDGGLVDKMAGDSGNNQLQGHAEFNQYYGGAGNDTFVLAAKFGQNTAEASRDFSKLATYITDFHGANGDSASSGNVGEHDFINLSGFGVGSKIETVGEASASGTSEIAKLYHYSIFDTHTGEYYNFMVNSLNGKALGAGDFNFYASTPVSEHIIS